MAKMKYAGESAIQRVIDNIKDLFASKADVNTALEERDTTILELSEVVDRKGEVKTVNGTAPDENGNVKVTIDNVDLPVFGVSGTTLIISDALQMAEGESF